MTIYIKEKDICDILFISVATFFLEHLIEM